MCTEDILILNQAGRFRIRPIRKEDSPAIRDIILETLVEHGAVGGGFASGDGDTQEMYDAFQKPGRQYFVIHECREGTADSERRVLGGAGYSYLPGEEETCELVKMYFRKEIRGLGIGKKLLQLCMQEARKAGYKQMYLETIGQMKAARGLYEHLGFRQIDHSMGETGHYSCDVYYVRELGEEVMSDE
jgi:putative acetyltransferase